SPPSSGRFVICFEDSFRAERILVLNPPTAPQTGVFEAAPDRFVTAAICQQLGAPPPANPR
ncbi:MAG: hypothetical protein FWD42_04950, partial [Solirubrobacterales bacterium]|nr:hypothetical protein [Solirubrobacterales bacterium]